MDAWSITQVAVARVYERVLSENEVLQNHEAFWQDIEHVGSEVEDFDELLPYYIADYKNCANSMKCTCGESHIMHLTRSTFQRCKNLCIAMKSECEYLT